MNTHCACAHAREYYTTAPHAKQQYQCSECNRTHPSNAHAPILCQNKRTQIIGPTATDLYGEAVLIILLSEKPTQKRLIHDWASNAHALILCQNKRTQIIGPTATNLHGEAVQADQTALSESDAKEINPRLGKI